MHKSISSPLRRIFAAAMVIVGVGAITAVANAMISHAAAKTTARATVGVKRNASLGQILDAGSKHLTVYAFAGDKGTMSRCAGACAVAWPPVTTADAPHVSGGARTAEIGTTRRAGGVKQVTYKGHPLYFFKADRTAQTAAGQGIKAFGARWWVISPAGHDVIKAVKATPTNSGGTVTTGSQTTPSSSPTTPSAPPTTSTPSGTGSTTTSSPANEWS